MRRRIAARGDTRTAGRAGRQNHPRAEPDDVATAHRAGLALVDARAQRPLREVEPWSVQLSGHLRRRVEPAADCTRALGRGRGARVSDSGLTRRRFLTGAAAAGLAGTRVYAAPARFG